MAVGSIQVLASRSILCKIEELEKFSKRTLQRGEAESQIISFPVAVPFVSTYLTPAGNEHRKKGC